MPDPATESSAALGSAPQVRDVASEKRDDYKCGSQTDESKSQFLRFEKLVDPS
jgi:hypothetical protein